MNYYINDYEYEKHELLIEEGDKTQQAGNWMDRPELFFYQDNIVKAGYSISIVNGDAPIVTFYNDLLIQAKDGHKLSVEEIMIFLFLLINETTIQSIAYLSEHMAQKVLIDSPGVTPDNILTFVKEEMASLN